MRFDYCLSFVRYTLLSKEIPEMSVNPEEQRSFSPIKRESVMISQYQALERDTRAVYIS